MAAASRPGPADARIPCPLCGGLIHPIAGRCKHCKGDVRAVRSARPAAAASLPALHNVPTTAAAAAAANPPAGRLVDWARPSSAPPAAGAANGHAGAHALPSAAAAPPAASLVQAVAAAGPIPLAIQPSAADSSQPILPPRPTGRFAVPQPPQAAWKSWPVIVIILAAVAIVVAVVLMLFPPGGSADAGSKTPPPPAPDRMDTNPTPRTPPATTPDPWSNRGATRPPVAAPDVDIDDVDPSSPPPRARPGGGGPNGPNGLEMTYAIIKQACTRLATCNPQMTEAKDLCERFQQFPATTAPRCAAADRCLRAIDNLSCDATPDDPLTLLQLKDNLTDCVDAMRC